MIRVIVDSNQGIILADSKVESYVEATVHIYNEHFKKLDSKKPYCVSVGNFLTAQYFRKALAEGKFDELEIQFEGKVIGVSKTFQLEDWPKGLGDYERVALVAIMNAQRTKRS